MEIKEDEFLFLSNFSEHELILQNVSHAWEQKTVITHSYQPNPLILW
jgi:hypothetical protein